VAETRILAEGIIERGRGPEIKGSRITVYDVFDEMNVGRTIEELAAEWRLTVEQVALAAKYVEEHREEVVREFAEIKAWHARERVLAEERLRQIRKKNPPANTDLRAKFLKIKAEQEARRARYSGGSQSAGRNGTPAPNSGKSGVE
jgi:uncharacterized protein (DUF433 family)